jgi:ABC-type nitrate/sulfonate/bicarbonate transport system substrate-binding protein
MTRDLATVTVNVFPGGFNWPIYVGQENGLFAVHGIAVALQGTPDSMTQMTDFAAGRFDIAMTAVDNIVAYVEDQGQAPIGPQPEFVAVMGVDTGFLSLVAAPEIKSVADLRGKTLSVDAMTTGYAFVLYEIMRRAGLAKDKDYEVVSAGGMAQRWKGLSDRRHQATLLSAPYNLIAEDAGFNVLVRATDVIGRYQGNVAAVRRRWAAHNRATVVAYIRAYREAVTWLRAPANRDEACAILLRHSPQFPQALAQRTYAELLHPQFGFFPDCQVDAAGVACVLALRARHATPNVGLGTIDRYYDDSFWRAASL